MTLNKLMESMIDVPKDLENDLMEFIYAYIISFYISGKNDERSALILLDYLNRNPKHPNLYQSLRFSHTSSNIMSATIGVQSYNFKYDMKDGYERLTFQIISDASDALGGFDESNNKIIINVESLKQLLSHQEPNKKYIDYILEELQNTIEHELMHFIQFNSFGKRDSKQIDHYKGSVKNVDEYVKYATSAVELIPHIKSEYNTFKNKYRLLDDSLELSPSDRYRLTRYFVGDTSVDTTKFDNFKDDFESHFFWNVKDKNKSLWKKAVKIFMKHDDKVS